MVTDKEVDGLVIQAQFRYVEQTEKLLALFGYNGEKRLTKYLGKYYSLLVYGRVDLKDKDMRRFLQLYLADKEVRRKLNYHYQSNQTINQVYSLADYIQHEVARKLDREDIKSMLVLTFLEKVNRYRSQHQKIHFTGYLYNSFRYDVYRYLASTVFSSDVLNQVDYLTHEVEETLKEEVNYRVFEDKYYEIVFKSDNLTFRWVNGHCHELFDCLEPIERVILKMSYSDKIGDTIIGKKFGYNRNTIAVWRNRAVEKLKEEYDFLREIGELED